MKAYSESAEGYGALGGCRVFEGIAEKLGGNHFRTLPCRFIGDRVLPHPPPPPQVRENLATPLVEIQNERVMDPHDTPICKAP